MNNQERQSALIKLGLLDPPADGIWGAQSWAAVEDYKRLAKLPDDAPMERITESLAKGANPIPIKLRDDMASKIIKTMLDKNFYIPRGARRYIIAYIEGINKDWTLNEDDRDPDLWTDRRLILEIGDNGFPAILGNWMATTEPGRYYTEDAPDRNPLGAARIGLGQHLGIWNVGMHRGKQLALVQNAGAVLVYRDKNQDYSRAGDKTYRGFYGINHHHGWDMARIGKASAGCLVGQSAQGHSEFMGFNRSDRRYQANRGYAFGCTVLLGSEVLAV